MEEIHIKIGKKLHSIRKQKGLSLDKLAELTEVSKSMLGQIERGDSIPTVTTLWKIANGLNLSFSAFMEDEAKVSKVSKHDVKPLIDENGRYRVFPIFPYDSKKQYEVFIMEIDKGYEHHAESHGKGVEEYIIVTEGILEVGIGEQSFVINEGEAIHLPIQSDHYYRSISSIPVTATLIIYYP